MITFLIEFRIPLELLRLQGDFLWIFRKVHLKAVKLSDLIQDAADMAQSDSLAPEQIHDSAYPDVECEDQECQ